MVLEPMEGGIEHRDPAGFASCLSKGLLEPVVEQAVRFGRPVSRSCADKK